MAKKKTHKAEPKAEHVDEGVAEALHEGDTNPCVESGADLDMWTIAAVAVASAFFVVATVLFVQAIDNRMTHTVKATRNWNALESAAYESDQATRLAGYRWVDRETGSVAIPVEAAKKITAHEGLPTFDGAAPQEPAPAPDEPTGAEEEGAGGAAPEEGAGGAGPDGASEEPIEEPIEAPIAPGPPPVAPKGKAPGTGKAPGQSQAPGTGTGKTPHPAPAAPNDPYGP